MVICKFWQRKCHLSAQALKNVRYTQYCRYRSSLSHLAGAYQPKLVESEHLNECQPIPGPAICQERHGTFRMILPPPNVTGNLHLGHALMATIQDVICRHKRRMGFDVEWIPGTDHAGIATQVVVEKMLMKEHGLSRHQLGREAFLDEVMKWKRNNSQHIVVDLKKLGCTLDWSKEYFTMDEKRVHAVNVAFVKLFDEGLIWRQSALVNWSCSLESAISDIEVETLQLNGATEIAVPGYEKNITFGRIYDISYRLCDRDEEIIVSTTRPETMLGDVAIAVHPQDERYAKYRNEPTVYLWHPFREEPIPLIFDLSVEPDFGTGAVKVTPAHDRHDFDIGQKHQLTPMQVFNEQGLILSNFKDFANLRRFEAREYVLEKLASMQLLRGTKEHAMNLPICQRSKDVIEYMLRPQWFLRTQQLADMAMSEIRSGRMQIVPSNFETEWFRWLEDCHDWCISRQLWWGHQIPAYLAKDSAGNSCWIAAINEAEARRKAIDKLNSSNVILERDNDVLDTWFSSALLPLSAFDWPATEYADQYPLDLMETGHDILFFWVARMTMLGLKLTGVAPFKKILLNGIVCDAHGRKMSKSLGNVITPQQVVQGATLEQLKFEIEKSYSTGILNEDELKKSLKGVQKMFPHGIPECGTDALRFTLCGHNIKSHFINFDVSECHTNKLFFNKIWQATKFTIAAAEKHKFNSSDIQLIHDLPLTQWDRWILSRLANTLSVCKQSFDNYDLHMATIGLRQFFYAHLCSVFIEISKENINKIDQKSAHVHCATLLTCLTMGLQEMSSFTPFIAAELLKHLPQHSCVDVGSFANDELEHEIAKVLDVCQSIRQLKSVNRIARKHEAGIVLFAQTAEADTILHPHLSAIKSLTQSANVTFVPFTQRTAAHSETHYDFYSSAGHMCSFGVTVNNEYRQSLKKSMAADKLNEKKLQKLQAELEKFRVRVESEGFRRGASELVQRQHLDKIKQLEMEIQSIKTTVN